MGASCCKTGNTNIITKHLEEKLGKLFWLVAHTSAAPVLEHLSQRNLENDSETDNETLWPFAGVYVLSITTGGSESEQVSAGFYGNLTDQVSILTSCPTTPLHPLNVY